MDDPRGNAPAALFRLEFGGPLGWGHLVRSGALAAELRRRGWRCDLWTGSAATGVPRELSAVFTRTVPLDGADLEVPDGYAWIVVDHYATSDDRLRAWRGQGRGRILAVDDEAVRTLAAADLVLNARLGLERSPYAANVPALLGTPFCLLRPGLWKPQVPAWSVPPGVRPVLVTLGGTDPAGALDKALEALADVGAEVLAPIVVSPAGIAAHSRAADVVRRFPHAVVLGATSAVDLAGWMSVCRLAISAGGGTLYELAALRLPFVAVVVAENQRSLAEAAQAHWEMPFVIFGPNAREELAAAVRCMLARPGWGRASFGVDALGACRVADAMGA